MFFVVGLSIVLLLALLLSHLATRAEYDMDYDGGRPTPLTKEQMDLQQRSVGFIASSIASRS